MSDDLKWKPQRVSPAFPRPQQEARGAGGRKERRRRSRSGGNIPSAYYWVRIMAWVCLVPGSLSCLLMLLMLAAGEVTDMVSFFLVWGLMLTLTVIPPIGVLLRKPWGFYLGIIANGVLLLFFPIGTILGGFTMKAFLDSKEAFGVR